MENTFNFSGANLAILFCFGHFMKTMQKCQMQKTVDDFQPEINIFPL